MHAHSFISRMNAEGEALAAEFESLPPHVRKIVTDLFATLDIQCAALDTMLKVNKKLLDTIDRLKG